MKLLVVGGAIGFVIGAGVTLLYFSMKTLVSANAKAGRDRSRIADKQQPEELPQVQDSNSRSVGA